MPARFIPRSHHLAEEAVNAASTCLPCRARGRRYLRLRARRRLRRSPKPAADELRRLRSGRSSAADPAANDLALAQAGSVPGAQGELLRLFVAAGGFPNDQEVPFSIDLVKIVVDPATGAQVRSKPDLDLSSIRICNGTNPNCNVAVMRVPPSMPLFVTVDQPAATDYVPGTDHGTLNIRRTPPAGSTSRVWDPACSTSRPSAEGRTASP